MKRHYIVLAIYSIIITSLSLIYSCSGGGGGGTGGQVQKYKVSGVVSGMTGTGLILQNKGSNDLHIVSNGSFTFSTALLTGATYSVTVKTHPTAPNQTCTASNNTGTISNRNITDVSVVCSTNTYSVGGVVSGLTGTGLVLQNNGVNNLSIISNGTFTFSAAIADGSGYLVTVLSQPTNLSQTCTASSNIGTMSGSNISSVVITCATNTYTISGLVSGLVGTDLVLRNNGADDLAIISNGTFTFATPLADGSGYNVTVRYQPYRQTCLVSGGTGTLHGANVTSVAVNCPATYETVYVSMRNAGVISVLDSYTTIATLTTITYGHPVGLAADSQLKIIYAANYDDNTVSIIDALSSTVVSTIAVGANPESLGVNPADHSIYVSNFSGNSVSVITYSAGTYTVSKTITVESAPNGFAIDSTTNKIYIPNFYSDTVSIIDAINSTATGTFAVSWQPAGVAVDPSKKRLYVSGSSGNVDVVDTDTNINLKPISIGGIGHQVVVDPSANRAYATSDAGYVAVIDTTVGSEKVLKNITCGTHPHRVAISTALKRLYVTNRTSSNVTIIDLTNDTVIDTIPVSGSPDGVVVLSP